MKRLLISATIYFILSLNTFSQETTSYLNIYRSVSKLLWINPDSSIALSDSALLHLTPKDTMYYYFLNAKGYAYYVKGFYDLALKYNMQAFDTTMIYKNKHLMARVANTLGLIHDELGDYDAAIKFFDIAIKYSNGKEKHIPLNNKANTLYRKGEFNQSIQLHKEALKIRKNLGNLSGVADCLNDIGLVYAELGNYDLAEKNIKSCLAIKKKIKDSEGIAFSSMDLAHVLTIQNKHKEALPYLYEALKHSKELGITKYISEIYKQLYYVYKNQNIQDSAFKYLQLHYFLQDSIKNSEYINQIAQYKTLLNTIQTEHELKLNKEHLARIKALQEKREMQRNHLFIVFVIVVIFAFVTYKNYKKKIRDNEILKRQKQEIEEKNFEITQSINYATKIQKAVLPDISILDKYLDSYFVFYRPRDKVSGDFYWWAHVENHTVITVADCTGHGVPGAFMSMLGASFLREIVEKEYITHTGVILRRLRKEIIKALKQKGIPGEQKDGMDMAIISINHNENTVQFSGANNPLYIITNDELKIISKDVTNDKLRIMAPNKNLQGFGNLEGLSESKNILYEIKPDKMPIAIYEKMENFTTHEFKITKGMQMYLFSDGFADQFGGPKGKKFKYKPFKHLLLENAHLSMNEQGKIIEKTFYEWIGNNEQVDDVTVIGIKI